MAQYPSTTAFGVKLRLIGGPGIHATHSRGNAITTPSAATPATAESKKLSVRSCRTSRPRLAPSASRTPISRRRADARARKRFERLAHTASKTKPTMVIATAAIGRPWPSSSGLLKNAAGLICTLALRSG